MKIFKDTIRTDDLDPAVDKQKQYSCWNCLLLHPSTYNWCIKWIYGSENVCSRYRRTHNFFGKKANGKSRPVYVEFVRYNTRELIYENKKSLKNQGFLEQKVLVAK